MAINRGKPWEQKFKEDFLESFPSCSIDRIYDTQGKMSGVSNISDFICYVKPNIFYIECKSHKGNTFPIQSKDKKTGEDKPFRQYEKLVEKVGIPGARAGIILWFIQHQLVFYVPISTITEMLNDGKKSIHYQDAEKYNIYVVPSKILRVYPRCDYKFLSETKEGE